jgi:hypothetical protein
MDIETWRHGDEDIETQRNRYETWKHEHGNTNMETWSHGHGDMDTETWKRRHGQRNERKLSINTWTTRIKQTKWSCPCIISTYVVLEGSA